MKCLVTGISGFIGSHIAENLLNRGHIVIGLQRAGSKLDNIKELQNNPNSSNLIIEFSDLRDFNVLDEIINKHSPIDQVFHMAAQSEIPLSWEKPIETFESNSLGTLKLITALQNHSPKVKFLYASTGESYGNVSPENGRLVEDLLPNAQNPYGISKVVGEMICKERAASIGMHIFIVRAFSHTGPRRGKQFSIADSAYQLAQMELGIKKDFILMVGDPSIVRTVGDVRDAAEACILLMEKSKSGEIYNLASQNTLTMGEIIDKLISLSAVKDQVTKATDPNLLRKFDVKAQIPDTSKLQSTINWNYQIPFEKTLEDLLNYWRQKVKEENEISNNRD